MKKSKKTIVCLVIVGMLLAGTSCSVLDGLLGGSGLIDSVFNKYPANSTALGSFAKGSADFNDLALQDRWGLVWNGMFENFTENTKKDSLPNLYLAALKEGLRVNVELYKTRYTKSVPIKDYKTNQVTGKTEAYYTYYHHVSDKNALKKLADYALTILAEQKDPETLVKWMEDFYTQLGKIEGKFNGFALSPYRTNIEKFALKLFEVDAIDSGENLADDSFGALVAKVYAEKYPAGYFIENANARLQVIAGTDADLVL